MFKTTEDKLEKYMGSTFEDFMSLSEKDKEEIHKIKSRVQEKVWDAISSNRTSHAGSSFTFGMLFMWALMSLHGLSLALAVAGILVVATIATMFIARNLKQLVVVWGLIETFFLSVFVGKTLEERFKDEEDDGSHPEQEHTTEPITDPQSKSTELH